jgi:hypothetical protein
VTFMTSPLLGASQIVGPTALPKLIDHCRDHLVAYYRKHHDAAAKALKVISQQQGHNLSDAQLQSKGHAFADKAMATQLSALVAPGLEQAAKLAQGFMPKPQADGNTVASLAAQQSIEQAKLAAQQALDKEKLGLNQTLEQAKLASAQKSEQNMYADKDRERQFQLALKKLVIGADAQEGEANRNQQDQAAMVAAGIEKMQAETDKQIAILTLQVQDKQKAADLENSRLLAEMKARNGESLLALKALLDQQSGDVEQVATQHLAGVLGPLLESIAQNNQSVVDQMSQYGQSTKDMMGQVADGLSALSRSPT